MQPMYLQVDQQAVGDSSSNPLLSGYASGGGGGGGRYVADAAAAGGGYGNARGDGPAALHRPAAVTAGGGRHDRLAQQARAARSLGMGGSPTCCPAVTPKLSCGFTCCAGSRAARSCRTWRSRAYRLEG